jgi:hypothetical protein
MATITKERCRVGYTISGNSAETRVAPEGAGQSFKAGAPLFLSASGRLRVFPTGGTVSRPDLGQGIAGIALQDAGNYTNSTTEVPFVVANDDTVFLSNVASRQSTATATLSYVYIGSVAGASSNGSRFFPAIKMKAATSSLCMVRGFVKPDTVGDSFGRVYFQFLKSARAFR